MKYEEFFQMIMVMEEYSKNSLSEALMEIYWQAFKDWSFSDFKKACRSVMLTMKFPRMPFISEINEAIFGPPQDQAAIAYETLVATVKQVSSWETVIFEDGAIGRAVEALGGWEEICGWSLDDWKFRKKDFEQLYLANLRQGRTEPRMLYGAFDRINGAMGIKGTNKPILVTKEGRPKLIEDKEVYNVS